MQQHETKSMWQASHALCVFISKMYYIYRGMQNGNKIENIYEKYPNIFNDRHCEQLVVHPITSHSRDKQIELDYILKTVIVVSTVTMLLSLVFIWHRVKMVYTSMTIVTLIGLVFYFRAPAYEAEEISYYSVRTLLKELGYRKRRYSKEQCLCDPQNRDAQFNKIARLKEAFSQAGLPVLSIDTKQKEMLGNFDRKESYYGKDKRRTFDHDFLSHAKGIVVLYGIYDCSHNKGYITLGTSKDTSEFVCDNILYYWQKSLQWLYPDAESMLILCDGGGSNSSLHHIVKQDFCKLSKYWI